MFAHVTFTHLVVNSTNHRLEPDDSQLVSEAFFRLEVGDESFPDASVQVLHPHGTALGSGAFEVSEVHGAYQGGKWNRTDFTGHVERYVRHLIESQGYQLGLAPQASTSVRECMSERRECWFEIPD